VTYHRKRRTEGQKSSRLDSVPGVGPARRRALLREFGSVRAMLAAGEGRVAETKGIGPHVARTLFESLTSDRSVAADSGRVRPVGPADVSRVGRSETEVPGTDAARPAATPGEGES
jgi:excinuclease ABC subunit C